MAIIYLFQAFIVYLLLVTNSSAQSVPAFFTFGDSVADVGNNNYINTAAKGNYYPNGVDFGSPTGRFTNGRTVFDILQQQVGFKTFTPPYLAPTTVGDVLLHGVNYASSGSGILNSTGFFQFDQQISFDNQVSYHGNVVLEIISRIGVPATQKLLRRALYAVAIGSHDILSKDVYTRKLAQNEYMDFLISRVKSQFQRLYNLGARKIMVLSTGLVGCEPYVKGVLSIADGRCADLPNQIAQMYNKKLKSLVVELNKDLEGAKFVYADTYRITQEIIHNYVSYGFENATSACCSFSGLSGCIPFSNVCPDRSKYVFWDSFHLTDAANVVAAGHMMDGNLTYMFPRNVRQLAKA